MYVGSLRFLRCDDRSLRVPIIRDTNQSHVRSAYPLRFELLQVVRCVDEANERASFGILHPEGNTAPKYPQTAFTLEPRSRYY